MTDTTSVKTYIERGVRLTEQRKANGDDFADFYKEASSNGIDKAALKEAVAIASDPKKGETKRQRNELVELYLSSAGIV